MLLKLIKTNIVIQKRVVFRAARAYIQRAPRLFSRAANGHGEQRHKIECTLTPADAYLLQIQKSDPNECEMWFDVAVVKGSSLVVSHHHANPSQDDVRNGSLFL